MNYSRLLICGLLACVALGGGVAVAQKGSLDDLVLASVNGEEITRRHLVQRLLDYYGEDALEKMTNRVLLLQAAKRGNITVTEDEVKKKIEQFRSQFVTERDYHSFLERSNLTEKQYQEENRHTLLLQKVALKDSPVADEDLQQYDIRMIVAPDKASAEKWEKELEGGADFGKLAAERSADPAGRKAGGRMRTFLKIEMLDVWRAIDDQKLAPGGFTKKPVMLTTDQWVLIRLERLVPVSSTSATEKDRLVTLVTRYRMDQWLAQARAKAEVQKKPFTEAVVATVNGEPITRAQLVSRLLEYQGEQALELMINRTLLLQSAKKSGVTVTETEADKALADFKGKFKKADDFQSVLTRNNITEKQLRDELRYSALMEKVALKEAPVTDEDLVQYDVRMMVAPDKNAAEKWIKELDNGGDFAKMAAERTDDPDGRKTGGKLRPFLKIELLDVWRAMDEQKLKPGSYTKKPVFLTDNTWVIIKLENRIAASTLTDEEKARLTAGIKQYRVSQWLNQTLASAKAAGKISRPVPLTPQVILGSAER
jgi:parvulin-like peptidyl-prolyl isomerase